jgi:hypothetical protein
VSFGDDVHDTEPREPDPLAAFDGFVSAVRGRLEKGRTTYGDRSFSADPDDLLAELQQEALDLAGWGFVLYRRIERMRCDIRAIPPVHRPSHREARAWPEEAPNPNRRRGG